MRIRTISAAAVAAGLLAIPVSGASAATAPAASGLPITLPSGLTFVPPRVGALSVDIGPTIINGKVVDPGLHVLKPAVSLPPMSWTPPSSSARPPIR
jgi:hypothetical protein